MSSKKWFLTAGVILAGVSLNAMPQQVEATVQPVETITAIDFSKMSDLTDQTGLDGWKITAGVGSATLVEDQQVGKALKMSRTTGGAETSLTKDQLGIKENEHRYVSIETKIKIGTENQSNQFSIPYTYDSADKVAFTNFTSGDWSQYKSHLNGSNAIVSGKTDRGQWQVIRMDMDLKTDTFRVSVDDEFLLAGADARNKVTNLNKIKYYADSWNTGTIYLQSVKVTAQKERTEPATFYVSNTGNDQNSGTDKATPWKTLDRVNQEHYIPGDKILFERGGIWEDQTFQPQGSGDAKNKITIASYGKGALPQITTNGKKADAFYICNQEYIEISELDVSNTVEGFTQVTNGEVPDFNNATRDPEQGKLLGEYRGIHIAGRDVPTLQGLWLHDLKVHDVTGEVAWIGNTGLNDAGIVNNKGLDGSKRTGGVLIECLQPTKGTPTQFSDITIEDSEFINNSFCGITIKQWHGSGDQYAANPGWDARAKAGSAPDYKDDNWYPHSNIKIQNNYVNQGASAYACNGIYVTATKDSVIQNNVLEHIGTCGIELYFADNVAIQYNEVSDVVKKAGGADDNAIDPDWRVTNSLIQYNYLHDCGEAILLCGVHFNSGTIRYNMMQDVGRSYVHYSMGSGYFQIYNNIFYRSKDGNGSANLDPWGGGNASYFNNIFYDGKGTGFNYSGSSNFSFYNNAYYGTKAPSKEKNAILLTEDPFEGQAPDMDRFGSFEKGVLLEANGMKPKLTSGLVAAGVALDANGYSIDDGLFQKGQKMNYSSLAATNETYFDGCVNLERIDYPTFEKTGTEAIFDSPKSQKAASKKTPTIGIFEVELDPAAVILKGTVTDGINPYSDATVNIKVGDKVVKTTTNEAGSYYVAEGLSAGQAEIEVLQEGAVIATTTATLKAGELNTVDIKVPLLPMPDPFEHILIDETFATEPTAFKFDQGSAVENGRLVITKGMGNASSATAYFDAKVAAQTGIDLTFDYQVDNANKTGLQFRDSYGRLVFALCSAAQKKELRTGTVGDAVSDGKAASQSEPTWEAVPLVTDKVYTIRLQADFTTKKISYQVKEKDGAILTQKLDVNTDATNLAKMNACSWWDSKPQYLDNFKLTGSIQNPTLPLAGKTLYAFGDSIVAGHTFAQSIADFAAQKEGLGLKKFAVNGATVMAAAYAGGQILDQVAAAPTTAPDLLLFDGGTNDAEYLKNNPQIQLGEISQTKEPASFDSTTFAGAFEKLVYEMKQKWPQTQLIYLAPHKMGSRDGQIQAQIHDLTKGICEKWGITLADVYQQATLDTNDTNQKNAYTFDSNASNGLPGINGSGTHPNLLAVEEFYLPIVTEALKQEPSQSVDKTALTAQISQAKEYLAQTERYTAESLADLAAAIATAETVLAEPTADQNTVDQQVAALQAAIAGLIEKETEVEAKDISLNLTGVNTVKVGKTLTVEVTIDPINTTNQEVSWKIANPKIVRFTEDGQLLALKTGTTRVTCTTANGLSATFTIRVTK